jgi:hypothetical protein
MLLKEDLATSKLTGDNDEATTKPETALKPLEGEIGTGYCADEVKMKKTSECACFVLVHVLELAWPPPQRRAMVAMQTNSEMTVKM